MGAKHFYLHDTSAEPSCKPQNIGEQFARFQVTPRAKRTRGDLKRHKLFACGPLDNHIKFCSIFRASLDYWDGIQPSTGRPYSAALSRTENDALNQDAH